VSFYRLRHPIPAPLAPEVRQAYPEAMVAGEAPEAVGEITRNGLTWEFIKLVRSADERIAGVE
jgi:hypothetical protein